MSGELSRRETLLKVIAEYFCDELWRLDPKTKLGNYRSIIEPVFMEEYLECVCGENKSFEVNDETPGEIADLLKEVVRCGLENIPKK